MGKKIGGEGGEGVVVVEVLEGEWTDDWQKRGDAGVERATNNRTS